MFEELRPRKNPAQEAVDKGFANQKNDLEAWLEEMKEKNDEYRREARNRARVRDVDHPLLP